MNHGEFPEASQKALCRALGEEDFFVLLNKEGDIVAGRAFFGLRFCRKEGGGSELKSDTKGCERARFAIGGGGETKSFAQFHESLIEVAGGI